ncbi:RRS1-domain-containing protein [Fistulina hepatica ATCC 64428]|uniref:Ribosome biogenesis regulatory protein n=2 Tax=Fistulina hepatica ATCC 64428 TaxID=1128425 RepID=A0A0D7AKE4_9AGAR|nr:RRS1-domain-containing protein [Fistulina hepatica ATCC 64428]
MDVSSILADQAEKFKSVAVEKDIPLLVDTGLLTVVDPNPIDEDSYKDDLEGHLQSLARDGVQALFAGLFSLPTEQSPDGPLAQLPAPTIQLPRAKPLPKPKPPTKWERFTAAKGIQHRKRDRKEWDEEKQEWVNRWGHNGKNRQTEEQWLTEVPANADADYDPRKTARDERKSRISKNESQRQQNLARAQQSESGTNSSHAQRKTEIEKTLASSRISTASMGRFDKRLDGDKKMRGVKRKFAPNEGSIEEEKVASLALLSRMGSNAKKMRRERPAEESVLNVRKAVRFVNKNGSGAPPARKAKGDKNRS